MSTLMAEILQKIQKAKEVLGANAESIVAVIPKQPNTIDPVATVSNTTLLLDTLVAFYSDTEKAAYFPFTADSGIRTALDQFQQRMNEFINHRQPTHASNVLTVADQLYSVCLQYGLITFGFPQKELGELVAEVRSRRRSVRKTAEHAQQLAQATIAKAEEYARNAADRFNQDTKSLREELDATLKLCGEERRSIEADRETMATERAELEATHALVAEMGAKLTALQETLAPLSEEVTELARTARTEVEAIKDHRSRSKDEMGEILKFYGEIEDHQKAMREAQKDAAAKLNDLLQKCDEEQAVLKRRTDEVVARNEQLQNDINVHLRKAVGVTLFSAFDQRRKGLWWGKWVWACVMLLAVCAGAGLSWWLADSIRAGSGAIEPAFFVKLSAVIPVTFAILFAARQYSNERRTEEEYAFKSAISVSLEPYKDLLERMQQSGHAAEADFVQKLLLEVFDNPVRRIYADEKLSKDNPTALFEMPEVKKLLAMTKDLDPDKARKMVELIGDIVGQPLKRSE